MLVTKTFFALVVSLLMTHQGLAAEWSSIGDPPVIPSQTLGEAPRVWTKVTFGYEGQVSFQVENGQIVTDLRLSATDDPEILGNEGNRGDPNTDGWIIQVPGIAYGRFGTYIGYTSSFFLPEKQGGFSAISAAGPLRVYRAFRVRDQSGREFYLVGNLKMFYLAVYAKDNLYPHPTLVEIERSNIRRMVPPHLYVDKKNDQVALKIDPADVINNGAEEGLGGFHLLCGSLNRFGGKTARTEQELERGVHMANQQVIEKQDWCRGRSMMIDWQGRKIYSEKSPDTYFFSSQ